MSDLDLELDDGWELEGPITPRVIYLDTWIGKVDDESVLTTSRGDP